MENFKEYTGLELLQLLDLFERDRFPSADLYKKKEEAVATAAEKLDLQQKESCWILERPYNERCAEYDEKRETKQKREEELGKQQGGLKREIRHVKELIKTFSGTIHDIEEKMGELEKSWQLLSFENIVKKE